MALETKIAHYQNLGLGEGGWLSRVVWELSGNCLGIVWAPKSKFGHSQNLGLGEEGWPLELSGNGLGIVWEVSGPQIQNMIICRIWAWGRKAGPQSCLGMVCELSGKCLGLKFKTRTFAESGPGGGRLAPQSCLGMVCEWSENCLGLKFKI